MNSKVLSTTIMYLMLISISLVKAELDPKNAVGIWLFNEGKGKITNDSSGHKSNGKLEKGATWAKGKFGHGIEFDGKDDYVEIAPSKRYNPKVLTVTFWMYPYAIGGNNPAGTGNGTLVVANGDPGDGGGANWWFEYWNAGNFEFKSCQAGCAGASLPLKESKNKWEFVAGIYNVKEYELYLNGEFKHKGTNKVGDPEKGLLIGSGLCPKGHGCDKGYFKVIIYDVAVFNVKLNKTDINTLMKDGLGQALALNTAVQLNGKLTTTWSILKTN